MVLILAIHLKEKFESFKLFEQLGYIISMAKSHGGDVRLLFMKSIHKPILVSSPWVSNYEV